MKPKKIRVNKKFANLNEAADYLNYYLNRNPEARISYADLLRLANNNGWTMEDQGLDNNSYRTVCTDDEGNELGIEMVPRFGVFAPNVEADPEDEPEEESEEEESEDEPEEGEAEEEEDDSQSCEEMFAWVQPGETFVWRDPEDDSEHSAEVVEVKSDDGKVHSTNTEIRAKVEGIDGVISIFCDEIVMLDGDEEESEEEAEDSEEDSDNDSEDDPEPSDPNEVEDAEIVEDQSNDSDKEDDEG